MSLETELARLRKIHTEMNRFTIYGDVSDLIKEIHIALPRLLKTIEIQGEIERACWCNIALRSGYDECNVCEAKQQIEKLWSTP